MVEIQVVLTVELEKIPCDVCDEIAKFDKTFSEFSNITNISIKTAHLELCKYCSRVSCSTRDTEG